MLTLLRIFHGYFGSRNPAGSLHFQEIKIFFLWIFWRQETKDHISWIYDRKKISNSFTEKNSKTINYQERHKMCDNTRNILEFNYTLILPPWILLNYSFKWLFRVQDCQLLYRGFISGGVKIWILCWSGKNIILLVRYAYCI